MVIKTQRKKIDRRRLKTLVLRFKRKLQEEEIPFVRIILFGSYATGKMDIDSDVDLAVIISSKQFSKVSTKLRLIYWMAKQIDVKLEPHILSTNDLNNRWLSLPSEIKKHGISL